MNLPLFSLKNRTLVLLVLLLLTAWGLFNYSNMSRREDPEIKISVALVITIWPGASAEKVEALVSKKLEDQIEQISEVKEIHSTSRENLSVVFVDADFESDVDMVWQKLRNKVAEVRGQLPDGVIGPEIKDDFGDVTVMVWSLSSDQASARDLELLAKQFKAELKRIDAVGKVELLGTQEQAIYIEGPLDSFTMYGFSPLRVAQILDLQNINKPSGYYRSPTRNYRLEPSGSFEIVDQLREAVLDVSTRSGAPLKTRDVFTVREGLREPPMDLMRTNAKPSVGLDVRMKPGHNIVAMGQQVKQTAAAFARTLPPSVELNLVHDQPRQVDTFIDEFMINLVQGLVIVILVLLFVMGPRAAAIVAVGLPLSIVLTFALMPTLKVDMESVAIASFIIALGMLVDNAIIVTDNIYNHLQRGEDTYTAAWKGVQELLVPVLTGTLGTVFAFLPLLIMDGEIATYIRALPLVVSTSLLASLLLAVTATPILAQLFLRAKKVPTQGSQSSTFARLYRRLMRLGFRLRWLVLVVSVAGLVGSCGLMQVVGFSFFPEADRDQFTVDIWGPEGSSIEATAGIARRVEGLLDREPQVESYATFVGKGGPRFYLTVMPVFNTTNYAQIVVNTRDKMRTRSVVDRLNTQLQKIAGAKVTAKNLLLGIPVEAPVAIRITGPDLKTSKHISAQIQAILKTTPGTVSVRDNLGEEVPNFDINIDSEALTMFGITGTEVALTLLTAYDGLPVTRLRQGEEEIPVYLRLIKQDRNLTNTLQLLTIPSQFTGGKVPLSAFATVQPAWSPGLVKRYNNQRSVVVTSQVHGRLADQVIGQAWPQIQALQVPAGYSIQSIGEDAERNRAFADLLLVFALIVVAILLLLVIQFGSLKKALVILFSVPLAFIGAIVGLYVSGNSFSFMAFLGVVSLAGMVIKNAVVWAEFVDRAQATGAPLEQAIVQAGQQRLRPILLTAATTVGGLFPLARFGGVLWEGMAWAMICGLSFATLLTLVVIPVIYYIFFRQRSAGQQGGSGPKMKKAAATAAVVFISLSWSAQARAGHPLQQYLTIANENALQIRSARLEHSQAKAQRTEALNAFVPIPAAEASATRLDREQTLDIDTSTLPLPLELPETVLANQTVYRVTGKVTVPLYAGGKRFSYLAAANHGVAARHHAVDAVQRGIGFATAALYVQLLEAKQRALVLQEKLKLDQLLVDANRHKMEMGMGTNFDLSYAETISANTERQLAMVHNEVKNRIYEFNDLLGRSLGDPVQIQQLSYSAAFEPNALELLVNLRNRPELEGLAEGCAASREMEKAAFGELLPTVALMGEGGYKEGEFGYTEGNSYWMVTAAVQWNFMADASAWAKVESARLKTERAQIELVQQRKKLELELSLAVQQHRDSKKILEVATRGVRTAQQGFDNAWIAYQTGVLPINTYVETAWELTKAKENFLRAYYARLLTELQLRYRGGQQIVVENNLGGDDPLQALGLRQNLEITPEPEPAATSLPATSMPKQGPEEEEAP